MKKCVCVFVIACISLSLLCSCAAPQKEEVPVLRMRADEIQTSKGSMTAKGNVVIDTDDYVIYAPGMVYTSTNSMIVFDGPVKLVVTNQVRDAVLKQLTAPKRTTITIMNKTNQHESLPRDN
jgi:hypothetical protein